MEAIRRKFIRLLADDETWDEFEADWRAQCGRLEEDFDYYAEGTFSIVDEIVQNEQRRAGVFALRDEDSDSYSAMCQVNKAHLPGYDGPVLRVRHITLSPEYDLTDKSIADYAGVLVSLLGSVLQLAYGDEEFASPHVKFHLRSPADQQFFSSLGLNLKSEDFFTSIETRGAWLYITL